MWEKYFGNCIACNCLVHPTETIHVIFSGILHRNLLRTQWPSFRLINPLIYLGRKKTILRRNYVTEDFFFPVLLDERIAQPKWWFSGDVNVSLLRIYVTRKSIDNHTDMPRTMHHPGCTSKLLSGLGLVWSWLPSPIWLVLADIMVMSFYFSTADLSYIECFI